MVAKQEQRKGALAEYNTIYKHVPDQPDVLKFISRSRKQIVINLSARQGAKIIKLLP